MRTLLIAPSFLVAYAVVVLSLGWLITAGGGTNSPNSGSYPSRAAFATWNLQMPMSRAITDHAATDEDEDEDMGEDQLL